MCWTQASVFPQPSVATYVMVRRCVHMLPVSVNVDVIATRPHASAAATDESDMGTLVGLQPRSRSVGHVVNTGAIVSSVHVNVAEQVVELPARSVAVKINVR